jgi:hypothetical protein
VADGLSPCTRCGNEMSFKKDISMVDLLGYLNVKGWKKPAWCAKCREKMAAEVREAKSAFYGSSE